MSGGDTATAANPAADASTEPAARRAADDDEVRRQVARAETLLTRVGELPDAEARGQAVDAVHALVTLYGTCLRRIVDGASAADPALVRVLASDELVGHLLLVHDLHPDPPAVRVRRALAGLRGAGGAELVGVQGTRALVRVSASACGSTGCRPAPAPESSNDELRTLVEAAVAWAAPEIETVEIETEAARGDAASPAAPQTLIPVEALLRRPVAEGHSR